MSEVPTEKVYLRTVLGAVFLVDSLGRILGRQHSFEVSGAHSSFIEARITVEPDGSWSPEVAKEYFDSCGGVSGWLSGKVANNDTDSAVELDLPGFSYGSLLINGEKFVREQANKTESKMSVEVDTSAIEEAIKRHEKAQKEFWKSLVEHGAVNIAGEVASFEPFPICPLESAISETVRHLREGQEFNLKAPPEVRRPDEPNQMLAQHLKKLLSAQYERMSK